MAVNQQRGLLRVVNDLGAETRVEREIGQLPSAGGAQAFASVASGFADIGARIGALADHAAGKEGAEAGRAAGLDPEFRPTRALTIRGEAYDKAGLETYGARVRTELQADLDAAFEAHRGDPGELAKILDAKKAKWSQGALPELRPQIEQDFLKSRLTYMRQASREQAERAVAEQGAAQQAELAQGLKTLHQRAFALGLDATADQALAGDIGEFRKALGRTGVDGRPLVAPATAAKLIAGAEQEVTTARLLGAFSRLPGVDAKQQFIARLEEDWSKSEGLARVYDLDGMRRVTGMLEGELRSSVVQASAASRALATEVGRVADLAGKGFAPPPAEMAGLKARIATAGVPELEAELADGEAMIAWQSAARRATPIELDGFIRAERGRMAAGGTGPREVARLELAEKLHGEMTRELKSDPLGWAERVGVLPIVPLDLSSAEKAQASFAARAIQARTVAEAYRQPVRFFRPDETAALADVAGKGGAGLIALSGSIVAGLGPDAGLALGEIVKDAPIAAYLGGLALTNGSPAAITDAANGVAMRASPGFKPLPRRDAGALIDETWGTAFAELGSTREAALATAEAIYEVRARRAGTTEFDSALYARILDEVAGARVIGGDTYGGIAEHRGRQVLVPRDIKADRFSRVVGMLRDSDLLADPDGLPGGGGPRDASGRPYTAADVRGANLVSIGQGRYLVAFGDPAGADPRFAAGDGPDGLYVLDLERLAPELKRRRPDLFLSYGSATAPPTASPAAASKLPDGARLPGMMRLGGPTGDEDDGGGGDEVDDAFKSSPRARKLGEEFPTGTARDVKEHMRGLPGVIVGDETEGPGADAIWREQLTEKQFRDFIGKDYPDLGPLFDKWNTESNEVARHVLKEEDGLSDEEIEAFVRRQAEEPSQWIYNLDPDGDMKPPGWSEARWSRFMRMSDMLKRLLEQQPEDINDDDRREIDKLLRSKKEPAPGRRYDPAEPRSPRKSRPTS